MTPFLASERVIKDTCLKLKEPAYQQGDEKAIETAGSSPKFCAISVRLEPDSSPSRKCRAFAPVEPDMHKHWFLSATNSFWNS